MSDQTPTVPDVAGQDLAAAPAPPPAIPLPPAQPAVDVAALQAELARLQAANAELAAKANVAAAAPAPAAAAPAPTFAAGDRVRVTFADVYSPGGHDTRVGIVFETGTVVRSDEQGNEHQIPALAVGWLEGVSGLMPLDDVEVAKVG